MSGPVSGGFGTEGGDLLPAGCSQFLLGLSRAEWGRSGCSRFYRTLGLGKFHGEAFTAGPASTAVSPFPLRQSLDEELLASPPDRPALVTSLVAPRTLVSQHGRCPRGHQQVRVAPEPSPPPPQSCPTEHEELDSLAAALSWAGNLVLPPAFQSIAPLCASALTVILCALKSKCLPNVRIRLLQSGQYNVIFTGSPLPCQ